MPRPRKKKRMPQITFKIPVETLVGLEIEIQLENFEGNEFNKSKMVRKILNDHIQSEEFQLKVKHFKTEHPKRYGRILRQFA